METFFDLSLIGGTISIVLIAFLIIYILLIVANWKIFSKAGEGGWKSLIPIYNFYIFFKISWKPSIFWLWALLSVGSTVLSRMPGDVLPFIAAALMIIQAIIGLVSIFKFSKAFGHGVGFFIGMLLIPNIIALVIAYGKSKYIGPQ